jgi:hypothetical protein
MLTAQPSQFRCIYTYMFVSWRVVCFSSGLSPPLPTQNLPNSSHLESLDSTEIDLSGVGRTRGLFSLPAYMLACLMILPESFGLAFPD